MIKPTVSYLKQHLRVDSNPGGLATLSLNWRITADRFRIISVSVLGSNTAAFLTTFGFELRINPGLGVGAPALSYFSPEIPAGDYDTFKLTWGMGCSRTFARLSLGGVLWAAGGVASLPDMWLTGTADVTVGEIAFSGIGDYGWSSGILLYEQVTE